MVETKELQKQHLVTVQEVKERLIKKHEEEETLTSLALKKLNTVNQDNNYNHSDTDSYSSSEEN